MPSSNGKRKLSENLSNEDQNFHPIPMATTLIASQTSEITSTHTAVKTPYNEDVIDSKYWLDVLAKGSTGFDPRKDLRLVDNKQIKAGIEAVAGYKAGRFLGNKSLLITAPGETLTYEEGNNTFGYVGPDYGNDFSVKVGDQDVAILIEAEDLPVSGFRRLYNNKGSLYAKAKEAEFTERDEDTFMYWYIRTALALLRGVSVRIRIPSYFQKEADEVLGVFAAEDPVVANQERILGNRAVSQANKTVVQQVATDKITTAVTGVTPIREDKEYTVASFTGVAVNLRSWPRAAQINLRVIATGRKVTKTMNVRSGSDSDRFATAQAIRKQQWCVELPGEETLPEAPFGK